MGWAEAAQILGGTAQAMLGYSAHHAGWDLPVGGLLATIPA